MRLIISEKANTAKKVSQFLAEDSVKDGKHRSVPHHTFMWKGEETVSVGLKGHVLNPEYPEEYSNWQKVEPRELIDAEILKAASVKSLTVIRMEVPCCGGLVRIAQAALANSGRDVPFQEITIGVTGDVLSETQTGAARRLPTAERS